MLSRLYAVGLRAKPFFRPQQPHFVNTTLTLMKYQWIAAACASVGILLGFKSEGEPITDDDIPLSIIHAPVLEEILFRGVPYILCPRALPFISTFLFGVAHALNYNSQKKNGLATSLQVIMAMAAGYTLSQYMLTSKNLMACMVVHALVNTHAVTFGCLHRAEYQPGEFYQSQRIEY